MLIEHGDLYGMYHFLTRCDMGPMNVCFWCLMMHASVSCDSYETKYLKYFNKVLLKKEVFRYRDLM